PVRTAITVEVVGDGAAARAGTMRGARIALLGRALLLAAQLGVELAQRGVEAFVDGGAAFGRGLRRGHAGVGAAGRSAPGGPAGARAGHGACAASGGADSCTGAGAPRHAR